MFTKKQLIMSIGLATIVKAIIITPANAKTDNIGVQIFSAPPSFSGSASGGDFTLGGATAGEGLAGGISIPPGMSLPTPGASGTSSGSSASGTSGDGSGASGTVTVADIADYFASSIDLSLDELDTNVAQRPRRIVRRRNSASCPNPKISRSSESLDDLLNQSEEFIEKVNQIKPENSIW